MAENDEGFDPQKFQEQQNEQPAQTVDYFGFSEHHKWYFPDGVQYIEFEAMNEGAKSKYLQKTSTDMILERGSGNARVKMNQAEQRRALIESSVTGWYMLRGGEPLPFTKVQLGDLLELGNPQVLDKLELEIRKANPWMLAEMSVKDIDREIENLQEMRAVAVERERGEAN